ncbi:MAG TPA: AraC family transcriptional regulator [Candidatus Limiplasma sp.]|nr:AraC family transcriptional regulator [Candidatus Limiplasma sp.]
MKMTDLDRKEYHNIVVYTMKDNNNGNLPVYLARISSKVHTSPMHRHEAVQINYITRGKLVHEVNHSKYQLVRGDIFIIPPYIPHQLFPVDEAGYELIELEFIPEFIFGNTSTPFTDAANTGVFDFAYIEPFLVAEQDVKPRLNLTGEHQAIIESLMNEIETEYNERQNSYLLALKADLLKLLVMLGRYFGEETKDDGQYRYHRDAMIKSIQYIKDHFNEDITIEEISKITILSQSYFSYLFKAITHKTFVEYVTDLRINAAMEKLRNTGMLVVDICFSVGFKSVNHFNRMFKKAMGMSPLQYRKLNRGRKDD